MNVFLVWITHRSRLHTDKFGLCSDESGVRMDDLDWSETKCPLTLSPADIKNSIALYYGDCDVTFKLHIRVPKEHCRLVASNPVACAHFYYFMVQQFVKHVLVVGSDHPGLYMERLQHTMAPLNRRVTLHSTFTFCSGLGMA